LASAASSAPGSSCAPRPPSPERAGPSVTLAFVVAAVGCLFAGLCYAEFASMIPIAGSAYTYSYATMGEFVAWIIGWDLVLEYAVGAATVAIAWSEYFNRVLEFVGWSIPYQWRHSPFEHMGDGVYGIMNIPAVFILAVLSALLIRGTRESAFVNSIIVVTKVSIVLMVIVIGWQFINPANHTPFIPEATTYLTPQGVTHNYGGVLGILGAAGVVFLRVHRVRRGLDRGAGNQESQEGHAVWHPRVVGRLHRPLCLFLVRPERRGHGRGFPHCRSRSLGGVRHRQVHGRISLAVAARDDRHPRRFSSVILVMLLGTVARVLHHESGWPGPQDLFGRPSALQDAVEVQHGVLRVDRSLWCVHPGRRRRGDDEHRDTCSRSCWCVRASGSCGLRRPDIPRGFTVPALPVVAVLGIIVCGAMIYGLGYTNWLRLGVWLVIGLFLFFGYARKHSRLETA
jgi:APA family basic amino acid/polyamine antiporter